MKKKMLGLVICLVLICSIFLSTSALADPTVTISIEIHKILTIDYDIDGDEADWYYHVGVSENGVDFNWETSSIPIAYDVNDLIVDETHTFSGITSTSVTIAIMLCEYDSGWGASDDLADISSDLAGGDANEGNPITHEIRGGVYVGYYNLSTDTLTGDTTTEDAGYYKTSGEYDGNSDEYDAALWFDITDISFNITSPSSGEIFYRGVTNTITWTSLNAGNYVRIALYKSGIYYYDISSNTSNDGSYSWIVPSSHITSSSCKIKIISRSNSGVYDESEYFSILEPPRYITITSPSSSETWYKGETETINWDSAYAGDYVRIDLYKSGSYLDTIKSSTSNDGSYSWVVPSSVSSSSYYKIKITSTSYSNVEDESDYFSIDERYITVNSPYSGSKWYEGDTNTITWNSKNAGSSVKIELYKSSSLVSTITSSTSNDGSHSWTIPSSLTSSSYYKIKITSTSFSSVNGDSNSFSIDSRSITVKSPNGGETWNNDGAYSITWNSKNAGSYVKIELYKNGKYYSTIASSKYNDGSYSWKIPTSLPTGSSYKIKITSTSNSNVCDYSNTYLTIKETWLQKWLWAIVVAVLVMAILIAICIRSRAKNKERKRIFEKGKKEIKDIIHKATSEKKMVQPKTKEKKKGEFVTDYNWHSINFSKCPRWLKETVKKYKSEHHPKQESVMFKGRHFRYKVNFGDLKGKYTVKRRLRHKHKVNTPLKKSEKK